MQYVLAKHLCVVSRHYIAVGEQNSLGGGHEESARMFKSKYLRFSLTLLLLKKFFKN